MQSCYILWIYRTHVFVESVSIPIFIRDNVGCGKGQSLIKVIPQTLANLHNPITIVS